MAAALVPTSTRPVTSTPDFASASARSGGFDCRGAGQAVGVEVADVVSADVVHRSRLVGPGRDRDGPVRGESDARRRWQCSRPSTRRRRTTDSPASSARRTRPVCCPANGCRRRPGSAPRRCHGAARATPGGQPAATTALPAPGVPAVRTVAVDVVGKDQTGARAVEVVGASETVLVGSPLGEPAPARRDVQATEVTATKHQREPETASRCRGPRRRVTPASLRTGPSGPAHGHRSG